MLCPFDICIKHFTRWKLLLFIDQLPTPNPSKNRIYTNKNFRTSCKMTYRERNTIQGSGLSTQSLNNYLLTASRPCPAPTLTKPSLRPCPAPVFPHPPTPNLMPQSSHLGRPTKKPHLQLSLPSLLPPDTQPASVPANSPCT